VPLHFYITDSQFGQVFNNKFMIGFEKGVFQMFFRKKNKDENAQDISIGAPSPAISELSMTKDPKQDTSMEISEDKKQSDKDLSKKQKKTKIKNPKKEKGPGKKACLDSKTIKSPNEDMSLEDIRGMEENNSGSYVEDTSDNVDALNKELENLDAELKRTESKLEQLDRELLKVNRIK
jgi:hypothetical protein